METIEERQLAGLQTLFAKYGHDWPSHRKLQYAFLYAYYEYFGANEADIGELSDSSVFAPGDNDHIAAVFEASDKDCNTGGESNSSNGIVDSCIVAIVPFHLGDFEPKRQVEECLKSLKNAESEIFKCLETPIMGRQELQRRLEWLGVKSATQKHPLRIVLLVDDEKLSYPTMKKIRSFIQGKNGAEPPVEARPSRTNVSYDVKFSEDVTGAILEIEGQRDYVPSADIVVDDTGNVCKYGTNGSVVVNISAKSLKELYLKYKWSGLFAQNLRLYVRMASVDDAIKGTVEKCPENFWYFNNGIIIICDDFSVSPPSTISLKNMSIVNGGQTTRQIGELDFDKDFFLLCKIIKNKNSSQNESLDFISTVADASNRQKPIKPIDLIANSPVQRLFKAQLQKAGIFCMVKRGEGHGNKQVYKENWQRTTNVAIAQILLSFMYQEPGLVRNSVSSVLSRRCVNLAFDSKIKNDAMTYSPDMIRDLLKFSDFVKITKEEIKRTWVNQDFVNLVVNCEKMIIALFGVVAKYWFNRSLINELAIADSTKCVHLLRQYDINCPLFLNTPLEEQQSLAKQLILFLCLEILYKGYEEYKRTTGKTIPSNFSKQDANYHSFILPKAIEYFKANRLEPGRSDKINRICRKLFRVVSTEEFEKNRELVHIYGANTGPGKKNEQKIKDKSVREKLFKKLKSIRKRAAVRHNVNVSGVIGDKLLKDIVKTAPSTPEELAGIGFTDIYGIQNEILKAIAKVQESETTSWRNDSPSAEQGGTMS